MPIELISQNPEDYSKQELFAIILKLVKKIEDLEQVIQSQAQTIRDLTDRLNKNSNNSSKPPSSDGYGKKNTDRSLREKTDKKRGGQVGHKGATLEFFENPDHIESLSVDACEHCGSCLSGREFDHIERRQVVDIPAPSYLVTEYIGGKKKCPCCSKLTAAKFPQGVNASISYGPNIQAHSIYLSTYQMVSYERIQEYWKEMHGLDLSQTTLCNFLRTGARNLDPVTCAISNALTSAKLGHSDETGIRINGKLHWIHSFSNTLLTAYMPHAKRGDIAMKEMNILTRFLGKLVHDHWMSYLSFKDVIHFFCNAHYLRELNAVTENEKRTWSEYMIKLLLRAKKLKQEAMTSGETQLSPEVLMDLHTCYRTILQNGKLEYPISKETGETKKKKRGRCKKTKGLNLLERLEKHEAGTLGFVDDFSVPFDNNLAERDLRMVKLKAKVSGCFRSMEGAESFCTIRGYVSTMRKQGFEIYPVIKSIFDGDIVQPRFNGA